MAGLQPVRGGFGSKFPEVADEFLHVSRYRRFEPHRDVGGRMPEFKEPGVQGLPGEGADLGFQGLGQAVGLGADGLPGVRVADHGVADMGHVDADLVGAAGFQPAFDQACGGECLLVLAEPFDDGEMGDGMARVVAGPGNDGASHAIGGASDIAMTSVGISASSASISSAMLCGSA